ncbi:proteasome maturation protein-like isoform X2 [Cyclopterus lumpus]|uniref:proteasome maturation protein-like isoform X2 n=1 Tax=Cyclopterus lumpus TaxID=8103 RepID=UPI00148638DC|nr:proteasome maturation protein-like isoform X2 [Cyclopterus lumpus]
MNTRGLRSQLKDSVPVAGLCPQGAYGVQDSLRSGFTSIKNELLPSHPLELSEKNFQPNQDKMNFSTLRSIQGLHAPLKLQMEYRAARQFVSHSSLPLLSVLLPPPSRSSVCRSCRVQTWLWIH